MFVTDSTLIRINDLPIINGDEFRIRQLFQNLIDNAVKYNAKGFVEVGYEGFNDKFSEIYVRNNGKGIEKAYHDKYLILSLDLKMNILQVLACLL